MAHSGFPLTMPSCPECRTRLDAPLHQAEACPRGHGVYLARESQGVLPRRARDALLAAEPAAGREARACASCATPMQAVRVRTADTTLDLDRCEACGGAWFDHDELVRITLAHRAGRPNAARARDPFLAPNAIEILLWSFA